MYLVLRDEVMSVRIPKLDTRVIFTYPRPPSKLWRLASDKSMGRRHWDATMVEIHSFEFRLFMIGTRSLHGDKEPGLFDSCCKRDPTTQQPIFRHLLDLRIQTEDCISN